MELLILLTVLLVIIAIAKILKAKELVDNLKDVDADPVTPSEIKTNATGMLVFGFVFFAMVISTMIGWEKYLLPTSASVHGVEIDTLMMVTMVIILIVFFITHALLFWFIYKYYFRKDRKAFWYPHNNRLEIAWTVVPASVLILLITYGMSTWSNIMNPEIEDDSIVLEVVSEQFKWTARYSGEDNVLGYASFALYGKNPVGVATKYAMEDRLQECEEKVISFSKDSAELELLIADGWNKHEAFDKVISSLKNFRSNVNRIKRMLAESDKNPALFNAGEDDLVINSDSIYLPKGRQVILNIRSKDVIHSAYLPHFRAQMNAVPGLTTRFVFEPRLTNEEMLEEAKSEGKNFTGYILLCNKICGASHYNMKLHIKVVEEKEYKDWLASQTVFKEAYK